MKILAIDPGSTHSGIVVVNFDKTIISHFNEADNDSFVRGIISGSEASVIVCEDIQCMGQVVGKTTFDTAKWIGRFWELSIRVRKEFCLIPRSDVKTLLCGGSTYRDSETNKVRTVNDASIRNSVISRYPATGGGKNPVVGTSKCPGPLYGVTGHSWSALALAITYIETQNIPKRGAKNGHRS